MWPRPDVAVSSTKRGAPSAVVGVVARGEASTITATANFGFSGGTANVVLNANAAGAGGTVAPGSSFQDSASSVQIQATPNTGFIFKSWKGSGLGSYTGTNNPATVTMSGVVNDTALFAVDTVIVTATAGVGGTISPSGAVKVPYGSGVTFNIAPSGLYHISDVVVDGFSVGPVTSYTFPTVTIPHTIAASFTINGYTITATSGAKSSGKPVASWIFSRVTPGCSDTTRMRLDSGSKSMMPRSVITRSGPPPRRPAARRESPP